MTIKCLHIPRSKLFGLAFVFLWFFLGGIAHFVATGAEMRIVPPYISWPRAAVLVIGVFELPGAFGLLWRPTPRAAGWGLFALIYSSTAPTQLDGARGTGYLGGENMGGIG
jgi:uncharacterized membrane protein